MHKAHTHYEGLRWHRLAGCGYSDKGIEVEMNDAGHYRIMYYGFGPKHPRFDVLPNKAMMLQKVGLEMGAVAEMMTREACRLKDAEVAPAGAAEVNGAAAGANATAGGSGACPE